MKGKLALAVVLLAALFVVGAAFAATPPPICPAGEITVTPAVWEDGIPSYTEHRHYAAAVMGCPTDIAAYTYHNDSHHCRWPVKIDARWHYADEVVITPAHWGEWEPGTCGQHHHDCEERTIPAILGYWLPPVCRAPVAGCMDPLALNYNPAAEVDDGSCAFPPIETEEPPIETEEPPCYDEWGNVCVTETPVVTEEPPIETEGPPSPESTPEPEACLYTVTTYFQCNTGAAIWAQETGITPGEGTNFVGYAPYNRECGFCDGLTGIYHREWRSDCDGSGWDEGTWNMPEEFHELNGCPLGGRCGQ